jgi:hypothetical protein
MPDDAESPFPLGPPTSLPTRPPAREADDLSLEIGEERVHSHSRTGPPSTTFARLELREAPSSSPFGGNAQLVLLD